MRVPPEVLAALRQWVVKAEHDLRIAEHALTLREECPMDMVCFHAQQCVEKYLKALLVLQGDDVPRTHDLAEVVALMPPVMREAFSTMDLEALTPYAVEGRYPGEWEPLGREEAEAAIETAKRVRHAARTWLPPDALA
jgi:HEPN domain-containing protein